MFKAINITVRDATPADFDALSYVAVEAHREDAKFAYLFPKRDTYEEAYRKYFRTHAEHHSIIPDCFVTVAEVKSRDGSAQIAGYCLWNRDRDGQDGDLWEKKEGIKQALRRRIITSMTAYYVSMWFNPAASWRHNLQLGNDEEHYDDPSYEEPSRSWGINELAVAPDF